MMKSLGTLKILLLLAIPFAFLLKGTKRWLIIVAAIATLVFLTLGRRKRSINSAISNKQADYSRKSDGSGPVQAEKQLVTSSGDSSPILENIAPAKTKRVCHLTKRLVRLEDRIASGSDRKKKRLSRRYNRIEARRRKKLGSSASVQC